MEQHAEALPQEAFPQEDFPLKLKPEKEPEKISAEILPFRRYEEYKNLGGILNPKEYEDVLKMAKEGKEVPSYSRSSGAANFMAQTAEINLSPETITLYEILCGERPGLVKEREKELSDQELLAEALRIVGNRQSLDKLIEKNPVIFGQAEKNLKLENS